MKLTTTTIDAPGDIMRWSDEWIGLLRRLARSSFFNGPEWAAAWWDTVGNRPPTTLALWRDRDDRLVALAHISRQKESLLERWGPGIPVATMLGAGAGAGDHLMFPALDEHRATTWTWFDEQRGRRPAVLSNLDPRQGLDALPDSARSVGTSPCPTIALPAKIRKSFAKRIRTYARRLDREGIAITSYPPGSVDVDMLTRFDELQQRRRDDQGRTSTLEEDHHELLSTITRYSGVERGLAAVTAARGDDLVGVLLGFATERRFEFYQIGWDPAVANLSVGTVLIDRAIHDAEQRGAIEFDFLRGDEGYKRRFGAQPVDDENWHIPSGPYGWVLALRQQFRDRRANGDDDGGHDV